MLVLAACEAGGRPHSVPRADVDTDPATLWLPQHGVMFRVSGMTGLTRTTIDFDTRQWRREQSKEWRTETRDEKVLAGEQIDRVRAAAFAAWDEVPRGEQHDPFDIAEHLLVLDGDVAFDVDRFISEDHRPRAAALLTLLQTLDPPGE
jgi:hypothetical protein